MSAASRDKCVSVVILTKNAGPRFRATLGRVCSQRMNRRIEVVVVDSGSTDSTLDVAGEFAVRTIRIEPGEFDHGHTRNLGVARATGSIVAFLTQDAVPRDERWLGSLVRALEEDPLAAGAYSRVLPGEGASLMAACAVLRDLNARGEAVDQGPVSREVFDSLDPRRKRLVANFNNVSSAVRRKVWEQIPFPRIPWGEDLHWGRAVIEAGYRIRFVPDSVVLHCHEYTLRDLHRRTWIDGRVNKTVLDRDCVGRLRDVMLLAGRLTRDDWRAIRRAPIPLRRKIPQAIRCPVYHTVEMLGLWRGGRASFPGFRFAPVGKGRLRILFVLHGFPPDTLAGTEIYTLNLLRELRERHDVAVFHRIEDPTLENYSLHPGDYEGIPVFRVVNNLDYDGIEETVVNRRIEEKFRWVLETVRPDIVHFQHCLHLSVSLVSVARSFGIPAVVTLHDYWFLCPKVQLIRPDRTVCRTRRPGLVCVGCSSSTARKLRAAKALHAVAPPLMSLGVLLYGAVAGRWPRIRRRLLLDAVALRRRLRLVRRGLSDASVLVSPSGFLKERYVRCGFDRDRILFSRNGLAAGRLKAVEKSPSGRVRFAFTGSILWYKGLDVLIRAFNEVDPDRATLDIHGDHARNPRARDHFDDLRAMVRSPSVTFHGAYRNEELGRIYAETDVLVVPSIWFENSPLTIQEAFASRTPVIASRLGAMEDLVRDGENGLLFEPGNPVDLAGKMRRVIAEPGILEELRRGIRPVKTIAENALELETLYRQALSSMGGARGGGSGNGVLPVHEIWGRSFSAQRGRVRRQGRDLVLLEPESASGSLVRYELSNPGEPRELRLEIETELLQGETAVHLGGTVDLNGARLGAIPDHVYRRGGATCRRFRFPCRLECGANVLEISNRPAGGGMRACFLRIKRILLYEGETDPAPQGGP